MQLVVYLYLSKISSSLKLLLFKATPGNWSDSEGGSLRWSVRKVFLEISQNSQENNCPRVSFLIKLKTWACNFIKKETLAQVFSCEFWEISKNIFSYRTLAVAVSGHSVPLNDHNRFAKIYYFYLTAVFKIK